MKIALLSRWLWEEHQRSGGEGGTVEQLATAVQNLGHEVIAISQSPEVSDDMKQTKIGSIETWLTPRHRRKTKSYVRDKIGKMFTGHRKLRSDALDLCHFLKKRGPFDLLWAQCEEPDGLVTAWARKQCDLPPVCTQIFALRYDFPSPDAPPHFKHRRTLRLALQDAGLILANSRLTADALRDNYNIDEGRIECFPHNLTHHFLEEASASEVIIAASDAIRSQRVVFLGALNVKKGALTFLRAAAMAAKECPQAQFSVIGDFTEKNPEFREQWQWEVNQADLGARLELVGQVVPAVVRERILGAAVVVLPSLFDEFSRALVEVLSLGTPVISTHTVGASYLLERDQSGVVIEPGNPAALASAIKSVLAEPSFSQHARKSAATIRTEFSPETLAAELLKLWQTRL